jgi:hypothetical protein
MTRYRILDLDNCIADDGWRIPAIDWSQQDPFQRYHPYHSLSAWDACCNRNLFEHFIGEIIICTGRHIMYRFMTEEWLKRNGVQYSYLLMRNNTDNRTSSPDVKSGMIDWLFNHYNVKPEEIEMCYDDRPDIIAMYRSRGLPAALRFIHNVCAYTPREKGKAA